MENSDAMQYLIPKLLVAIIDRDNCERVEDILREKREHFQYMFHAMGTASSERLKAFGLSGTEKAVCISMVPEYKAGKLMTAVRERIGMNKPGNGIVFVMSISGISGSVSSAFLREFNDHYERLLEHMDHGAEINHHEDRFELVVAIVNKGYSDAVMAAAHTAGAKGGTIINARRTSVEEAAKFFGISIQAEKDMVAIIIPKTQKSGLMQAISKSCGTKTDAKGIVLSLPVDDCAGLVVEED